VVLIALSLAIGIVFGLFTYQQFFGEKVYVNLTEQQKTDAVNVATTECKTEALAYQAEAVRLRKIAVSYSDELRAIQKQNTTIKEDTEKQFDETIKLILDVNKSISNNLIKIKSDINVDYTLLHKDFNDVNRAIYKRC
jgi:hypothetical protein